MVQYRCPSCTSACKEEAHAVNSDAAENTVSVLSCPSCSTRYAWNEGILQFVHDEKTEVWDAYWKRVPVYDDILDVLRTIMNLQLRRYLEKKIAPSSATLEPGGGSAYVSAMLAEKGHKAYAMDYASAPLRIAQKQLKSKAILVQGDLFNIPFSDSSFDLVFNNSTMEHFKNPLDGMKEMARTTRKGGYVFVGVPFTYGPLSIYKLKKSSFKDAWDGTTYDRKGLKKLFTDAGLEVVHSRTFFFRCFIGVLGKKK